MVLALGTGAFAAPMSRIDSLMRELDETIGRRDMFMEAKEREIDSLKKRVDGAADNASRFNAMGDLFDVYLSYDADSAFVYADRRKALGDAMANDEMVIHARLNQANILGVTGSFKESLEIIDSICRDDLPDYLVPYYYHIKRLIYGNMADYSLRSDDRDRYLALTGLYRDSLLTVNDRNSWAYALIQGDAYNAAGQPRRAIETLNAFLDNHRVSDHEQAIFAYTLAEAYHSLGDSDNEKLNLVISSIGDLRAGVREYVSLRKLAMMLYGEGEVEKASELMRICLADAVSSHSRHRIFEINEVFPMVNEMYIKEIHDQQTRLTQLVVVIGVLLLFLAVAVMYVYKQMKRARRATRLAEQTSLELREINGELKTANEKLSQANGEIREHSHVKTEYIGRYMELSLQNIDTLSAYRKHLRKLLAGGKLDQVVKSLDSDAAIDDEYKKFYADFDRTFLNLFPTFIEDFNALLEPEGRSAVKTEGALTTELRIYALIRLGITDSVKIAKFLRYSVTTIYNYRTKVRNRALGDRSELEQKVMNIGK